MKSIEDPLIQKYLKGYSFWSRSPPNWVNSVKFEFTQLKSDQMNQLKSNTLQKL